MKIGIHSLAHPHAEGYLRLLTARPDLQVAIADPPAVAGTPQDGAPRGRAAAEHFGVDYFDDLAALLAWQPDGVIVCTENARHRAAVEEIAAAGVPILCEKPLATTLPDADAMIAAAAAAGVPLMVAYPVRFSVAFDALRSVFDGGGIGELISFCGTNNGKLPAERDWFAQPELSGGGAIMDHTVHLADLLTVLLPEASATSVYARANTLLHADRAAAETGGLVSIEFDNGVIGTIDCSWSSPSDDLVWGGLTLQLIGSTGIADLDAFDAQHLAGFATGAGPLRRGYGDDANATMLQTFLDAVADGRSPQPDGATGRRSMAIALAAYRSLSVGEPVAVE